MRIISDLLTNYMASQPKKIALFTVTAVGTSNPIYTSVSDRAGET
jgi:hypothetical protein